MDPGFGCFTPMRIAAGGRIHGSRRRQPTIYSHGCGFSVVVKAREQSSDGGGAPDLIARRATRPDASGGGWARGGDRRGLQRGSCCGAKAATGTGACCRAAAPTRAYLRQAPPVHRGGARPGPRDLRAPTGGRAAAAAAPYDPDPDRSAATSSRLLRCVSSLFLLAGRISRYLLSSCCLCPSNAVNCCSNNPYVLPLTE